MAGFIVVNFRKSARHEQKVSLERFKNVFASQNPSGAELICLDRCRKCLIFKGKEEVKPSSWHFPPLEVYVVGEDGEPVRADFGRYHDEKICFRFELRRDGSSEPIIVKSKKGFYLIPAYFGETRRFDSLDEAAGALMKEVDSVSHEGDFY